MTRTGKLIVGVVAGVAAFVLLAAVVFFFSAGTWAWSKAGEAMNTDPLRVAEAAAQIAEFRAPDGFRPGYAVNVAGFEAVEYTAGDGHSHLYLVRAPKWLKVDQATFERRVEEQLGQRYGRDDKAKLVETRTVRINGEPVVFAVNEGVNSDGDPYRSMTGVWETGAGQVLLSVTAPLASWNQAEIDAFLAGIHQAS